MRLTSILSVTVVAICLAACSAAGDFDQAKRLMNDSPVHSHDLTAKRLLRAHQENGVLAEERWNFNLSQLTKKKDAKKLAKALMADHKLAKAAYISWEHHPFTLKQLDDFLKLASSKTKGKKYAQLSDGHTMHLGLTGY
ncbi:hypothetical protein F444_22875 [Phytophthora nicotianae P1976]|uniref:RxLR effector protein n=1 Tax=Phytophthora nicotianae P1976 TaxID=1317066 RepID=A0A080YWI4_PHYNI|nr:hypothetical protein F444_22875 [Phytophthora nicotianae P1976]